MARCTICTVYHRRVHALTGADYVAVRHRRPHEYKEGPLLFVRQPAAVTTPCSTFDDGSVGPTGAVVVSDQESGMKKYRRVPGEPDQTQDQRGRFQR